MIQFIKNINFKYKLIVCFFLVIAISSGAGIVSYKLLKDISNLVYITYDKALMSGTFAQAVKFDYASFDSGVKAALLSETTQEYERDLKTSQRAFRTLLEDLEVVEDRSLDPKAHERIEEVRQLLTEVQAFESDLLTQKKKQLGFKRYQSDKAHDLWMAWDKNKIKKSIYRKLTIITDESAVLGYQFRLSSEEKNNKSLSTLLYVVGASILLGTIFAFVISFLMVRPLLKLEKTCNIVGEGDYSVRAPIESKDEVGRLAKSFNAMLDLIQEKNENISSLLSSLPFGLFYFDKKGHISEERSEATDKIFFDFSKLEHLEGFYQIHGAKSDLTNKVIDIIFSMKLPFDSAVGLLPSNLVLEHADAGQRLINLSYKPNRCADGSVERVIVLAEDVTSEVEALKKNEELTERVGRVSRASEDSDGFMEFVKASRSLLSDLNGGFSDFNKKQDATSVLRDLHSLKGLLEVYGFSSCAKLAHKLESYLVENKIQDVIPECLEKIKVMTQLFDSHADDIIDLLAINKGEDLKLFNIKKIEIIKMIAKKEQIPELVQATLDLDKFPIDKIFKKYSSYTKKISSDFSDKDVRVVFDTNSDELTFEEAQKIDLALIHIIRNSIDHGIETKSKRIETAKKEFGEIRFSCKRLKEYITVDIADDGQGINAQLLAAKALEKGIWSPEQVEGASDSEKLNLIFMPSFSTKDEVSDLSGRGVGMDAVKDVIESHGGQISIMTKLNQGTTFSITLPTV